MQLLKDFTAEHAWDKLELYMGMVMEEEQTFVYLVNHHESAFQSGETISELISDLWLDPEKEWIRGCLHLWHPSPGLEDRLTI